MLVYLKVLSKADSGEDVYALHPATDVFWGGDSPYLTWLRPSGGTGSHYRGDFIACWLMSETGGTLDKVRGFTPDEAKAHPRE